MDESVIKVLTHLRPFGIGVKDNIAEILNGIFPYTQGLQSYEYSQKSGDIQRFIDALIKEDYISLDVNTLNMAAPNSNPDKWFQYHVRASITANGVSVLNEIQKDLLSGEFTKSAIDTNQSILATNKSVQKTNEAIINSAKEQGNINKAIKANTEKQTEILTGQAIILTKQTSIFFATAIFAFASVLVGVSSIAVDFYKSEWKKEAGMKIQLQQKEIEGLKHRILELQRSTTQKTTVQKKIP